MIQKHVINVTMAELEQAINELSDRINFAWQDIKFEEMG